MATLKTLQTPAINTKHAQYVVATLGLLIDIVGRSSFLATLLRQTQNEILSLLSDQDGPARKIG